MDNVKVFFFFVLVVCIGFNVFGFNFEGIYECYDDLLR